LFVLVYMIKDSKKIKILKGLRDYENAIKDYDKVVIVENSHELTIIAARMVGFFSEARTLSNWSEHNRDYASYTPKVDYIVLQMLVDAGVIGYAKKGSVKLFVVKKKHPLPNFIDSNHNLGFKEQ